MEETPAVPVSCPKCGAGYRVAEALLGRRVRCRHCGVVFTLRRAAGAGSAAQPEVELNLNDPAMLLGRLAVRFNMVSVEALEEALATQRQRPENAGRRIGDLLVDAGLLTPEQIEFLLSVQRLKEERIADQKFGELAVRNELASLQEVEAAMVEQKRLFMEERKSVLVGDLLVEAGVITEEQRDALLASQKRLSETAQSGPAVEAKPEIRVTVSEDRLEAFVVLERAEGAEFPDAAAIEAELREFGVVHGIDEKTLAALAAGERTADDPVLVAEGQPAVPGQDGAVEFFFETEPLKVGRENENGIIDFRDRGETAQVSEGTLLARKTPPSEGSSGTDVFGEPLDPPPPHDPPLEAGTGTEHSADRLSVTAAEGGHPARSPTGVVSVYQEYHLDGDVDMASGNVSYDGRVVIKGAVQKGFKVTCSELVADEVDGAEIHATGDVFVNGGIIGANVRCGGTVKARYLQGAKLDVEGDVIVERELVDSTVDAGGALLAGGARLLSATISAHNGVFAKSIGSENSSACRLVVGTEQRLAPEVARLEAAIAEGEEELAGIPERLDAAQSRGHELEIAIGEQVQVQDRAMVHQRELEERGSGSLEEVAESKAEFEAAEARLNELFEEQDTLQAEVDRMTGLQDGHEVTAWRGELAALRAHMEENPGHPFVQVSGAIEGGTIIKTPHLETRLKQRYKFVRLEEQEQTDERGRTRWHLGQGVPRKGD